MDRWSIRIICSATWMARTLSASGQRTEPTRYKGLSFGHDKSPTLAVTCMSGHPMTQVTEHTVRSDSHTTFYLAAGPLDGPLIIFVHGWPELAISWRHQL